MFNHSDLSILAMFNQSAPKWGDEARGVPAMLSKNPASLRVRHEQKINSERVRNHNYKPFFRLCHWAWRWSCIWRRGMSDDFTLRRQAITSDSYPGGFLKTRFSQHLLVRHLQNGPELNNFRLTPTFLSPSTFTHILCPARKTIPSKVEEMKWQKKR